MYRHLIVLLTLAICVPGMADIGETERAATQAQLDAACESARESKLAPMRADFVKECVKTKERPDKSSCERFYADFGAGNATRGPLFYDLPECVKAESFRTSQREPSG